MASEQPTNILSVSDLNHQARLTIEQKFQTVWVTGEMSNFAHPRSGHWYFSLKDQQAQVRCAMFANRNRAVQLQPGDGQQVLIRGRVSLYEGRGDFQIIADLMEPAGEGALRQAFDQLKIKLAAEGLFDSSNKQALPLFPQHCAVVTSPTGAAWRDVLAVWQRRFPAMCVTLVPSSVQGADAEQQLVGGLQRAIRLKPNVILLTRGGGSLEDLWSFNSELLARAIAQCPLPVVSAIGHEIDTTISDLVADVRAPTPSAAAELITPNKDELISNFRAFEAHITSVIQRQINNLELQQKNAQLRLGNPRELFDRLAQRIDDAVARNLSTMQARLKQSQVHLSGLRRQLPNVGPAGQLTRIATQLNNLKHLAARTMAQTLARKSEQQVQLVRMLHNLSPLPTLARGYAVVRDEHGTVVSSVKHLAVAQLITSTLHDGTLEVRIDSISDKRLQDS